MSSSPATARGSRQRGSVGAAKNDSNSASAGADVVVGVVGKVGWLSKGFVYILAGLLALYVAGRAFSTDLGPAKSPEASPTGAILEVRGMTGGRPLLFALAVGLTLYCVWRILTAVLPGKTGIDAIVIRAGYLVSAAIYGTFALTSWSLARDPGLPVDGNRKVQDITATVLHKPFGRWIIGAAGAIAVGAGLYRMVKAARRDVTDELKLYGLSPSRFRWTKRLAVFGEAGRGIAVSLIGFFLIRSAMTARASEATGLDGALNRLASNGSGRFVVAATGLGFVLYGVMCVETFTRRKLPLNEAVATRSQGSKVL